jgi:AraC-like DNA-binding protein
MRLTLSMKQPAFQQFGAALGGEVGNRILHVNNSSLQGSCYHMGMEEGLRIFIFDLSFNIRFSFTIIDEADSEEDICMALYCFSYEGLCLLYRSQHGNKRFKFNVPSLILSDNKHFLRLVCNKNAALKCIAVLFTHKWFTEQLSGLGQEQADKKNWPGLLKYLPCRPLSKAEQVMGKNVSYAFERNYNALEVKGILFTLLSFIHQHVPRQPRKETPGRYVSIMMKVAMRITASLSKPMPSVEELASEFYLSPSTVKRQFKKAFGIGLYDYYLAKKMELAKTMLETGKEKVSTVAFYLGYENPSHFISSFKKIYGHSPGRLKK